MIDPAALKAEHSRGYITNRFTGEETPGSCETCVPRRAFPCAAWLAADELEKSQAYIRQTWDILDSFPAQRWGQRVAVLKSALGGRRP